MNRETESHFSQIPYVDIERSRMDRSFDHKTSLNFGDLIPVYCDSVLPGDTVEMTMSAAMRMSTPVFPVMDSAWADIFFFYVPYRILWRHTKEFYGENTATKWIPETEYKMPAIEYQSAWTKGSVADYLGIPPGVTGAVGKKINAMPFRAYVEIWNQWFRDQNLQDPAYWDDGDATLGQYSETEYNYQTGAIYGIKPLKVAKAHDYFTSCLPGTQKAPEVNVPLGGMAPVSTRPKAIEAQLEKWGKEFQNSTALSWQSAYENGWKYDPVGSVNKNMLMTNTATDIYTESGATVKGAKTWNSTSAATTGSSNNGIMPINLWADLSQATGANITQLREAFAIQRFAEAMARGGSRYREIIQNIFHVTSPDGRVQIPEYLGGHRVPINMQQVVQTSSTDSTSPQGNTAAFSLTNMAEHLFNKSFVEPGLIIGVMCCRTDHTYQQGIYKEWLKFEKFDYYWPQLAHLSEQAVLNEEIYLTGTNADKEAFGYQERYAEYRYRPSMVSGAMRSSYNGSLDSWHYADYYESQPILGSEWIQETTANVDRTLAVSSSVEDQLFGDFYFKQSWTRPMPIFSVPGLIDHY
ncbi:major capsid protein [Capybara microvirus Cap1_SP_121]|nr:major capsid protein [Capybara microvirus Cap1_SP_121]